MTAPTSEERREVTERLRNEAAGFRRLSEEYDGVWAVDLGDVPAIFQDIAHYVGLDGVVHADVIFDRIADFIDPTCTAPLGEHERGWLTRECSECGYTIKTGNKYCPNCGARLVR